MIRNKLLILFIILSMGVLTQCTPPRWPLENPPPVAGSKSPTLRQQNGCKLIQFLF